MCRPHCLSPNKMHDKLLFFPYDLYLFAYCYLLFANGVAANAADY